MYLVLSGSCQVRARPLRDLATITAANLDAGQHANAAAGLEATTERLQVAAGGAAAGYHPQRWSTVEPGTAGGTPVGAPAASSGGVLQSSSSGVRRTTWEGAAFTAQEQAKLEATKAALEAHKYQVGGGSITLGT